MNVSYLDGAGIDQALTCPICRGHWLHQGGVEIFNRLEDSSEGSHVTASITGVTIDNNLTRNPSRRRHGLFVAMECEQCGKLPNLALYQHKGLTLFGWLKRGNV
jgi:hypothetical protein